MCLKHFFRKLNDYPQTRSYIFKCNFINKFLNEQSELGIWARGLAVMTSASQVEGRQFESGRAQFSIFEPAM